MNVDTTPRRGDLITGVDRTYLRSIYRVLGFEMHTFSVKEVTLDMYGEQEVREYEEFAHCFVMEAVSFDGWQISDRDKPTLYYGRITDYRLATDDELREENVRILIERGRKRMAVQPPPGGKAQYP